MIYLLLFIIWFIPYYWLLTRERTYSVMRDTPARRPLCWIMLGHTWQWPGLTQDQGKMVCAICGKRRPAGE